MLSKPLFIFILLMSSGHTFGQVRVPISVDTPQIGLEYKESQKPIKGWDGLLIFAKDVLLL